jgi:transcriptional regulator with XRE-family HTH domain
VNKLSTVATFRSRLLELINRNELSQARFAARSGLDRSTLSQLLSEGAARLPRSETIVKIAARNSASVDWLLGLSETDAVTADIVTQPAIASDSGDDSDENLRRWHEDARGHKVRYVPATLPDQLKTAIVARHENARLTRAQAEQLMLAIKDGTAHMKDGGSEIEVCSSRQSLESFARGEGIWRNLPLRERRRQLQHMAELLETYYPAFRWFMFDGREAFAAPYTVFGSRRSALYVGSFYFVFTSREHIRQLTAHFDGLIRSAQVQPNEAAKLVRTLLKDLS